MEAWAQNYLPSGSLLSSSLLAALPLILLLVALGIFRLKSHIAGLLGLFTAILIAFFIYRMPPPLILTSSLYGALYGLFPIGWIVFNALFFFEVAQKITYPPFWEGFFSGQKDKRLLALLIAFCLGAFLEAAAGFGTPVALTASLLVSLGFNPSQAGLLALLGNTAPVAFGGLGTPIIALATATSLPLRGLSASAGIQLFLPAVLIPFLLIWVVDGWQGVKELWPACFLTGLSYAVTTLLISTFHGPWLVGITAAMVSFLILSLYLWLRNKNSLFHNLNWKRSGQGMIPWTILLILVFAWGMAPVKDLLSTVTIRFPFPGLNNLVLEAPLGGSPQRIEAIYNFDWLANVGTALFFSALLTGVIFRKFSLLLKAFLSTLSKSAFSLLTIALMLSLGYLARFSGISLTLGEALSSVGFFFPFTSPILGWLGVVISGSDTSSNILFGPIQRITSERLGLSPAFFAASNSTGGVMGKMISPQTLVIATAALGGKEAESSILKRVFPYSLFLLAFVAILIFFLNLYLL